VSGSAGSVADADALAADDDVAVGTFVADAPPVAAVVVALDDHGASLAGTVVAVMIVSVVATADVEGDLGKSGNGQASGEEGCRQRGRDKGFLHDGPPYEFVAHELVE